MRELEVGEGFFSRGGPGSKGRYPSHGEDSWSVSKREKRFREVLDGRPRGRGRLERGEGSSCVLRSR